MAVRIRLKRVGSLNKPVFRIVVADSRSPRDGKFIEEIGTYHPLKKGDNVVVDTERGSLLDIERRAAERYGSQLLAQSSQTGRRRVSEARRMQGFLEYVVKGLVVHPEVVSVTPVDRNGLTVYELRLHPDDVGRVVGRKGNTINALRTLLLAGSARIGQRCSVEIVEEQPES